jgi:hypothetical protein
MIKTARDLWRDDISPHMTDEWSSLQDVSERSGRSRMYAQLALSYAMNNSLVEYNVVPVWINGRNKLRYQYKRKGAA